MNGVKNVLNGNSQPAGKLGCLATHPVGRGGVTSQHAACDAQAAAETPVRSRRARESVWGEKDCINSRPRIDSIGIPVELLEGHTVTGTCCFDMCTHDRSASSCEFFCAAQAKKTRRGKKTLPIGPILL